MNKRSLRILEFNKILSMVTEYATSPMAKRRVDRMKPQRDIEQIRKLQEETNDALNRLNRHGNISFSGLCDIGASIKRLEVQGTLTSKELLDIAAVLQVAKASIAKDTAELFYFLIPNLFPSYKESQSTHKILFYSCQYFLLIFSILLLLP